RRRRAAGSAAVGEAATTTGGAATTCRNRTSRFNAAPCRGLGVGRTRPACRLHQAARGEQCPVYQDATARFAPHTSIAGQPSSPPRLPAAQFPTWFPTTGPAPATPIPRGCGRDGPDRRTAPDSSTLAGCGEPTPASAPASPSRAALTSATPKLLRRGEL